MVSRWKGGKAAKVVFHERDAPQLEILIDVLAIIFEAFGQIALAHVEPGRVPVAAVQRDELLVVSHASSIASAASFTSVALE